MAGVRAAGADAVLFGRDPPDDEDPPIPPSLDVPTVWQTTLEAVMSAGVLDDTAANQWSKALTRHWYGLTKDENIEDGEEDEANQEAGESRSPKGV